jgi:hypothetical protein
MKYLLSEEELELLTKGLEGAAQVDALLTKLWSKRYTLPNEDDSDPWRILRKISDLLGIEGEYSPGMKTTFRGGWND